MLGYYFILLCTSHSNTSSPSASIRWRLMVCFARSLLNLLQLLVERTASELGRKQTFSTAVLSVVLKSWLLVLEPEATSWSAVRENYSDTLLALIPSQAGSKISSLRQQISPGQLQLLPVWHPVCITQQTCPVWELDPAQLGALLAFLFVALLWNNNETTFLGALNPLYPLVWSLYSWLQTTCLLTLLHSRVSGV